MTHYFENWSEEDLEDLDRKFDALCEFLNVEFVFERVSDGSEDADRERVYVRSRGKKAAPEISVSEPTPKFADESKAEETKYFGETPEPVHPKKKKSWN